MRKYIFISFCLLILSLSSTAQTLVFHTIKTDNSGYLIPWYSPNRGASYNHCLELVTNFWKDIDTCCNGEKFYMIDHSYNNPAAGNKVGGDQFAMLLSSWALYYAYTGDTFFLKDMQYIADTYLDNSLSPDTALWSNLPYPCNVTNTLQAVYDGDYLVGKGYIQPDKAGSFAAELITLYKITGKNKYLQAAIKIANTLAEKVQPGDSTFSPYPFRVHAINGDLPLSIAFAYTAGFAPTLRLFEELSKMGLGNTVEYDSAYAMIKRWVQKYPQQTNEWGSFFENIPIPSNTQINAVSMAQYILDHPDWSPTWQQDARNILDWTLTRLGSNTWNNYGATAIYEQTSDMKEGGSHTARFAAAELLYISKTNDYSRKLKSYRQLDWSTYLVNFDGQCKFSPQSGSVWYTDGYGDFVRHFIKAMAIDPEIAPDSSNHLLGSSSVVSYINYEAQEINYSVFDNASIETLRLTSKPFQVLANGIALNELSTLNAEGWTWTPYNNGGSLKINHENSKNIQILWSPSSVLNHSDKKNILNILPNPANETLTLHFNDSNKTHRFNDLQIFDIFGKEVKGINFNDLVASESIQLNISFLANGTYFLKSSTENEQFIGKFIVIK